MSQRLLRGKGRRGIRSRIRNRPTVRSVNRKVNRIIRGLEKKTEAADVVIASVLAGEIFWLTPIAAGDGGDERDGLKILAKTFKLRYTIKMLAASTHDNEIVRVIIFIHKQTQNAKTAVTTLLGTVNVNSYVDRANESRFRIVYDRAHVLNRLSVLAVDTSTSRFEARPRVMNMPITFNTQTVAQATGVGGENNQIYLCVLTDAAANGATFRGSLQFKYIDS